MPITPLQRNEIFSRILQEALEPHKRNDNKLVEKIGLSSASDNTIGKRFCDLFDRFANSTMTEDELRKELNTAIEFAKTAEGSAVEKLYRWLKDGPPAP